MEGLKHTEKIPERLRPLSERIESTYTLACSQNERVKDLPLEEVKSYITEVLTEIDQFEESAQRDPALRGLSQELAQSIGVIWVLSGPGTYYEPVLPERDPGYAPFEWTHGMDKVRLDYTARLARKITEASTGITHVASPSTIESQIQKTKNDIASFGPHIIYNSAPTSNAAVEDVLSKDQTVIPAENVTVIGGDIKNTVDQMKTFRIPDGALKGGKKIALVAHAPHLSRIIRMINRYKPFPADTEVILFPMATPGNGRETYAARETSALMYYTYLSVNHDATREPYPYEIYEPLRDILTGTASSH